MDPTHSGTRQSSAQRLTHFNDRVRRYVKLFTRRWWLVMLLISGGVCLQAWKTSKLPDEYQSKARIVVSGQLSIKDRVHYREEMANFYGTAVQILQSAELKRRVKERVKMLHAKLAPTPVNLTIERQRNSSVFNLELRGREPRYAQAYLDALLDEYINFRQEMRSRISENTLDALSEELAKAEKRLSSSRGDLEAFQAINNLVVLEEGRNSSAQRLLDLKSKVADLRARGKSPQETGHRARHPAPELRKRAGSQRERQPDHRPRRLRARLPQDEAGDRNDPGRASPSRSSETSSRGIRKSWK